MTIKNVLDWKRDEDTTRWRSSTADLWYCKILQWKTLFYQNEVRGFCFTDMLSGITIWNIGEVKHMSSIWAAKITQFSKGWINFSIGRTKETNFCGYQDTELNKFNVTALWVVSLLANVLTGRIVFLLCSTSDHKLKDVTTSVRRPLERS